ncbi:MAG: UDP-3-O-(3-hydroxymyristoyl)glucosamine N-acyltransferase [Acidobacteriota bacterium]|nr:UDP-3-O-(3-hydroxymyristoyl)glucosamine N-acyltransferase [Acidobacteriota bacterium]
MKLSNVASKLGVHVDNAATADDPEISGVAGIEEAGPQHITFVSNPKYAPLVRTTKAAAVIVSEDFPAGSKILLRSKNPYLSFAHAIELFYQSPRYDPGVHSTALVHPSAKIGSESHIGPYVVINEDVEIGNRAVLLAHVMIYRGVKIGTDFFAHSHAVIREHCRIGNRVLLQNGVVIGADGFGFAKDNQGHWHKIVQSGPTILADDVEVQANACIDRASVGETYIGRGSKVDNLAQVGHGSRIGEDTLVCAQVGLAGSSNIGNKVILAGQVGVAGHCKIGDEVIVTAQSGTHGDIAPGSVVSGSPAFEHKEWMRATAIFSKLPELARRIRRKNDRE